MTWDELNKKYPEARDKMSLVIITICLDLKDNEKIKQWKEQTGTL